MPSGAVDSTMKLIIKTLGPGYELKELDEHAPYDFVIVNVCPSTNNHVDYMMPQRIWYADRPYEAGPGGYIHVTAREFWPKALEHLRGTEWEDLCLANMLCNAK